MEGQVEHERGRAPHRDGTSPSRKRRLERSSSDRRPPSGGAAASAALPALAVLPRRDTIELLSAPGATALELRPQTGLRLRATAAGGSSQRIAKAAEWSLICKIKSLIEPLEFKGLKIVERSRATSQAVYLQADVDSDACEAIHDKLHNAKFKVSELSFPLLLQVRDASEHFQLPSPDCGNTPLLLRDVPNRFFKSAGKPGMDPDLVRTAFETFGPLEKATPMEAEVGAISMDSDVFLQFTRRESMWKAACALDGARFVCSLANGREFTHNISLSVDGALEARKRLRRLTLESEKAAERAARAPLPAGPDMPSGEPRPSSSSSRRRSSGTGERESRQSAKRAADEEGATPPFPRKRIASTATDDYVSPRRAGTSSTRHHSDSGGGTDGDQRRRGSEARSRRESDAEGERRQSRSRPHDDGAASDSERPSSRRASHGRTAARHEDAKPARNDSESPRQARRASGSHPTHRHDERGDEVERSGSRDARDTRDSRPPGQSSSGRHRDEERGAADASDPRSPRKASASSTARRGDDTAVRRPSSASSRRASDAHAEERSSPRKRASTGTSHRDGDRAGDEKHRSPKRTSGGQRHRDDSDGSGDDDEPQEDPQGGADGLERERERVQKELAKAKRAKEKAKASKLELREERARVAEIEARLRAEKQQLHKGTAMMELQLEETARQLQGVTAEAETQRADLEKETEAREAVEAQLEREQEARNRAEAATEAIRAATDERVAAAVGRAEQVLRLERETAVREAQAQAAAELKAELLAKAASELLARRELEARLKSEEEARLAAEQQLQAQAAPAKAAEGRLKEEKQRAEELLWKAEARMRKELKEKEALRAEVEAAREEARQAKLLLQQEQEQKGQSPQQPQLTPPSAENPGSGAAPPSAGGIKETKESQRWPLAGELACVCCGRFGEYECGVTGNVVCSRECKFAQLPKAETAATKILGHAQGGQAPMDYGAVATIDQAGDSLQALSFDGRHGVQRFFTAGAGLLRVWEVSAVRTIRLRFDLPLEPGRQVKFLEVSKEGGSAVLGGSLRALTVLDLSTDLPSVASKLLPPRTTSHWPAWAPEKCTLPSSTDLSSTLAAALKTDSPLCFASAASGDVLVWDLEKEKLVRVLSGHGAASTCVGLCEDGTTLLTGSMDTTVILWDLVKLSTLAKLKLGAAVQCLSVSPREPFAVAGTADGFVHVIDVGRRSVVHRTARAHASVQSLCFSHSGDWFISTGKDPTGNFRTATVWPLSRGEPLFQIREPDVSERGVTSCCIAPSDTHVLLGTAAGSVHLYVLKTAPVP